METTIDRNSYSTKKKEFENNPKFDREKLAKSCELYLEALGVDWKNDPAYDGTIKRFCNVAEELQEGMAYSNEQIASMFNKTFDTQSDNDDLVTIINIPFFSYCQHHLLPMYDGFASVAYIPEGGKVIGLSKVSRIVEMCAHRLQLQEKLGEDIAECISLVTGSKSVAVVLTSKHMCQVARGAKSNATTRTATLKGLFRVNSDLRKEFYSLID